MASAKRHVKKRKNLWDTLKMAVPSLRKKQEIHKVIGEGAYGCVHKPSIHCKTKPNNKFDYKHYVSKLMLTKNAIDELNEFVVIKQYDPNNEYHLGTPEMCTPNITNPLVKQSILNCKYINAERVENNPDDYKLFVVKIWWSRFISILSTYNME